MFWLDKVKHAEFMYEQKYSEKFKYMEVIQKQCLLARTAQAQVY